MNGREKYLEAYYENEYDANRQMAFALLFAACMLIVIWLGYIFRLFNVTDETLLLTNIVIPITSLILISPMIWIRTNKIKKPRFKYFILFSFLFAIAILNIVIPKHIIIGWAICIVLSNHYYNPKEGKIIFIVTLISMLICIYLGMFIGEFDSNLLMGQLDEKTGLIHNTLLTESFADSPRGRYEYLHALLEIGQNRYLTAFIFYYLARASLITILFFVSNALNKRTYKLLVDEIKVNSEQQKTKTELEVAKEIQLATLPTEFITSKDIEIQAELKAAKEVGGDFYDYFILDDDHTGIVIGDVSGKGIPAAMFMMKTITCFKNYVSANKTPAQILKEVNSVIFEGNESSMFVTCFFAIINTKTGEIKYANAGHNPPIIGNNHKYRYLKCKSGFVLGALKEAFVIDEVVQLNPGDTITLYTDGITEARNNTGELFGENRLIDFYNSKDFSCLLELHHDLKDNIFEFVKDAIQSDDMTYLTLKYHGDEYNFEEKTYIGTIDNIPKMLDFLKDFSSVNNFDKSFVNQLLVVGDELLSNIVKYGYKDKTENIYLRLLYNLEKHVLIVTIIDTGSEFNPFLVNNKPLEGDVSHKEEGGLGILIVKQIMTNYLYDRINGKNIVILKKQF